jgi:hypothetical protein
MNKYRRAGFIVGLAVTLGFASTAFCGVAVSKDLKGTHTPETLLAQASEGTASATAEPASSSVCHVPREYIRRINSREYDKVGELFSDDAVYMGPDGKTRHGTKEIGAFYKFMFTRLRAQISGFAGLSFLENGNECIMELGEPDSSGGNVDVKIWPVGNVPHPTAIDIFTINSQGKASKFLVYLRPGTNINFNSGARR